MSPSIRTMGFFMSEINFCNTKEQLNHLGEVVTGKVDGSPSGADIETSTLSYTGQVRKTLPALEGEYETSIATKQAEADAAIDEYRLLNKGPYAAGITLESKFEYITYNGESYFATNPPYTTTATTPDADGNLFAGGYTTLETVASKIGNPNLLSNSNFLTPSPDAITHPNATPESYVAGTQIFSGVYAGSSGVTVTLIDGRVNCSAGSYEHRVPNTNGLDRVPAFTSSVSDYDGNPVTTGVSHALVGDEYVVTVTPAAGDVFSVKFEQGDIATRHEVGSGAFELSIKALELSIGEGARIWPQSTLLSASVGDIINNDTTHIIVEGTLYPLSKKTSGTINSINLVAKPYTANIGGDTVYLFDIRFFQRDKSNVKAFWPIYDYFLDNGSVNPSPTSIHAEFQAAIDYAEANDIGEVHLGDGFAYMSQGVEHEGNIKISGVDSNNSATVIYSDLVGLPVIKAVKSGSEGLFYKPRYQNFKINGIGSGVNRPIAVELRLCSEFEFDHFYVQNCTDAVLLDNAAIGFYERFDAIDCARVFTFKSTLATTPNNNAFHEISNCNIFNISEAVFSFESGACDNITMRDSWIESFNSLIQASGSANDYPVSLRKLSIVNSKISDTSSSTYTSRLMNILGESSSRLTQFLKIKFEDCEIETTNASDMVRINDNGNSNSGSLFCEDLIFEDCELFGATDQVVSSTSITTTASFRGRTTARVGFFSGAATPWTLGTNVTLLDTPLTSYNVTWTAGTTNPTIGNGTLIGRYQVINGVCNVEIELNIGSSTVLGVGAWSFGLPINHINGFGRAVGSSAMLESGVQFFVGSPFVDQGASTVQIVTNESGSFVGPSNPFIWGDGDRVTIAFDYPVINPIT